ncbi:hypothetical protein [Microbacterium sp. cx-59]|uniref:hypothetical protein n=1 Tax=Microbacterium sp. cx-59 TaxID=2891207 RepID=UPI001E314B6F|nr:hypothetical protein [Microbacterium sp. cx-59]MCC4907317.1 hypothetical protein [Microbacterium sp. cx-59]
MTDTQTMVRTEVQVNGDSYLLAQGQDVDDLCRQIEQAARAGATFVEFIVVGNRATSVLITSHTQVVISSQAVQFDARDNGDGEEPFGGFFDF